MMTVDSPLGSLIAILVFIAFIATPLFASADRSWHQHSKRTSTIDGLRGFLAIGVFFHHALIYHRYLQDGIWAVPSSNFYTELGESGVMLFFMITGFLFWGKVINEDSHIDWVSLYIGRVFRIGPLYFLATALLMLVVFWNTGFVLHESAGILWQQLSPLVALGVFMPGNLINGYVNPWIIIAGVTWSLKYEWLFYLTILPISAILTRMLRMNLGVSLIGLFACFIAVYLHPAKFTVGLTAFFVGMTCAVLNVRGWISINRRSTDILMSVVLLILLSMLLREPTAYALLSILILSVMFTLISSGCSLFGILHARFSLRLGEISYGIYILQGLALFALLNNHYIQINLLASTAGYWIAVIISGLLLISAAMLAHILLEKPFIDLGRHIATKVRSSTIYIFFSLDKGAIPPTS